MCCINSFVATYYDSQFVSTSYRSTNFFHKTELGGSVFSIDSLSEVTEDFDYDVDASATTLLGNMTNRDNFNFDRYLPSEDHYSLTPEERDLWRKLPPK